MNDSMDTGVDIVQADEPETVSLGFYSPIEVDLLWTPRLWQSLIESKTYHSQCGDPDVKTKLEEIVRETIRRESHVNENVVKKNCAALKEKFKDFASLYQRPSKDTFPWTFVEPQDALGSLKSCSKNMAERTIDEQNA